MSTPIFFLFRLTIVFFRSETAMGSIPAKGSSKRINFGLEANDLAISVLLLSPPESLIP